MLDRLKQIRLIAALLALVTDYLEGTTPRERVFIFSLFAVIVAIIMQLLGHTLFWIALIAVVVGLVGPPSVTALISRLFDRFQS